MTAGSCLLTRAGDVLLTGTATQAGPEAVVRLLDDLLASCSNPDAFSAAVANGTALDMIDELGQHTTAQRRRAEVASVALRGLAAESAAAGAMAGAAERDPAADFDDFFAAPTPAASPTDWPWSSVTALAPPAAIPMLDDQTDARLGDSAVGDAEVRRPGRDEVAPVSLRELVAAANAAAGVARAMADADEQHPSADVGDAMARQQRRRRSCRGRRSRHSPRPRQFRCSTIRRLHGSETPPSATLRSACQASMR